MADCINLAQRLIRHPSVTPKEAGVMDTFQKMLEGIGFQVWREIFEEEGTPPVENLYARLGNDGPNFCYAGHLDVVPVGDEAAWTVEPFGAEIKDDYLYGRGAEDMKGAIACYAAAVARFVEEHKDFKGSLSFLITMDEEGPAINGTKKMLQWLESRGEVLDFCLVGEPTNPHRLGEMIKIGRRGSMNCRLKVKGQQGHAAYPQFARNPVTEMVKVMHALKQTAIDDGTDYFQPSNLEITSIDTGNEATNVIPASCTAKFNIRFNDVHSSDYLKSWITEICDKNSADYDLQMQVTGEAFQTEPNQFIRNMRQMIAEKTGEDTELSTTGGTSDARFIKDYCPVVEFGTTGRTAHQVDENVALETLHGLTDIYFEALKLYFKV